MNNLPLSVMLLPPLVGVLGLLVAALLTLRIMRYPALPGKPSELARLIQLGAQAFMRRELILIAGAVALLAVILAQSALGIETALSFLVGAACSALAGLLGMMAATRANVRTATAAHQHGIDQALMVAFYGGSVMGMLLSSLGLLGLGVLYLLFGSNPDTLYRIHGFGMGAGVVALFYRVGGGIFTKAADIGADLVGKLEVRIAEDDPRNPGVIADNVGDNVGDVAGMGSDIFESYCGALIATMALAAVLVQQSDNGYVIGLGPGPAVMGLPLLMAALGLICAALAIAVVKLFSRQRPAVALRAGTLSATLSFVAVAQVLIAGLGLNPSIGLAVLVGCLGGIVIGLSAEYYTGAQPVRDIARSGQSGAAIVIITGLATGMRSVVVPMLTLCTMIYFAHASAGLYGVGLAAVAMLATVGMTMAIDAYGPIADNAGGIAEMAGLGAETRKVTDALDVLGNTTAAIGKGFAIGAAALAALTLISAYMAEISHRWPAFSLDLSDPLVLIGLFLGGLFPFLVAAWTMTAVSRVADLMIEEIRHQFRSIPGLIDGNAAPDSERCVDIATRAALRHTVAPAALAVLVPVIVGFVLGAQALGGLLAGALVSGVLLALTMANAGGAWDNAKKYVEQGHYGGRGSSAHRANLIGDAVGDPLKDTSGPSMNILINVMAIVSLVIAPLLTH